MTRGLHQIAPGRDPLGLAPNAAMAIVHNRASKIDLLLCDEVNEQLLAIANSYANILVHDVCEFLACNPTYANAAHELCNRAIIARDNALSAAREFEYA